MTKPFGPQSLAFLNQAHPALQKLFIYVNDVYQCTVVAGARTKEEEQKEIDKGLSHLKNPLDSKHVIQPDGFCHALDVCPDPVRWDDKNYTSRCLLFAGEVLETARRMGIKIRYGGDPNTNFNWDFDHFELVE
jgi:peptidoglycan L-alanyl-D-glutamate endopeptidase CwlK